MYIYIYISFKRGGGTCTNLCQKKEGMVIVAVIPRSRISFYSLLCSPLLLVYSIKSTLLMPQQYLDH